MPDTIYVTIAGLSGDFAPYNGTWTFTWDEACHWTCGDAPWGENDYLFYDAIYSPVKWALALYVGENCGGWMFYMFATGVGNLRKEMVPGVQHLRKDDVSGHLLKLRNQYCNCTGAYTFGFICNAAGCDDTDSCVDSAEATCYVSYT